ncbi:MAG: hypothetical protein I3264_02330 [Candidatus Moeniiplasma glomeromycotorum]|nr:hypothetical protein [Candidatus Moeniiplasma glomeromycotorum]
MNGILQKVATFWFQRLTLKTAKITDSSKRTDIINKRDKIYSLLTLVEIENYVIQLHNEVNRILKASSTTSLPFKESDFVADQSEYLKIIKETFSEIEKMEKGSENELKNYEQKLKNIVGSDLTNWETKVVKAGHNDKDLVDLQQKVSDLTQEKSSLTEQKGQLDKLLKEKEGEVADKQAQILNHRCETPNQQELNQIKAELTKISAERDLLKVQLGQKGSDLPLPEENENNDDLTLEELKNKLKQRQIEVRNLQNQLKEKEQQLKSSKPTSKHSTLSLILFGSSVLLFSGSLVSFWLKKKKKKKKTIILPVFLGSNWWHFSVRPQALAI